MPFRLQAKGGVDIAGFASIFSRQENWTHRQRQQLEVDSFPSEEPTSVLHMRKSTSPPTSVSTLSSSSNGGAGGNTTDKTTTITGTDKFVNPVNNERNIEWATELQPIPSGLEFLSTGERCGLGLEDWENMLTEPSQEHSLLRWVAGDVDDTQFGLKQSLQSGSNQLEFNGNAGGGSGVGGLGIVEQGPGFESLSGIPGGVSSIGYNSAPFPCPGVPNIGSGLVAPSSSGLVNFKNVGYGSNNNSSLQSQFLSSPTNSVSLPFSLPAGMIYHQNQQQQIAAPEEKPHILNPNLFLQLPFSQQENRPLHSQLKRHNSGGVDPISHVSPKTPFSDPGQELFAKKTPTTAAGVSSESSVSLSTTSTEAVGGEEGRFRNSASPPTATASACFVGPALQGCRDGRDRELLPRARDIGAAQSTTLSNRSTALPNWEASQ
ncbi:SCARECROW-LIKE PROTEIN 6 [Salix viminalis]|uniref:SCARECROW-LIKE PROTEIN 6 n=1 Tax=Salix viminalis TaxID=40686 RepID=A0A9Q0QBU5_SALVM|nr:SCARECROW-LIKE PROTEIN 6 [Salix viminalis]